jgi:hypothetical protein
VHLDVLAGGDVHEIVLGIALQRLGNSDELFGHEPAARYLDAHHVHAFLALTIHSLLEPNGSEAIGVNAPVQKILERLLEVLDFVAVG